MKENLISIAIPTYEMGDYGKKYLEFSINKIIEQSYKNIQIVISDHSINNEIENLCKTYDVNIKYIKNEYNRGNFSENLNNALMNCDGDIIKLLMQDDYLCDINCLKNVNALFDDNKEWIVCGCLYGNDYEHIKGSVVPFYDDNKIVNGINTIGSPSVLSIKNKDLILFDKNFQWVTDLDYYKKMYNKYGNPYIIENVDVFILQHNNQITATMSNTKKNIEEQEFKKRYSITN